MLSLALKFIAIALMVLLTSAMDSIPSFRPSAAPVSKKPTSPPTYEISDCTATTCSVYFGSQFIVSPGAISARVYLPSEFTLSFGIRRPILSTAANNIFQLRAADAELGSNSLMTFSMDSQGVSNTVYNGQLLQAAGVVADYVNTYTTFTLTYASNVLSVQSSAEPNTITTMYIAPDSAVDTTNRLFYLYTSAPGTKDASLRPLLQTFTLGGEHKFISTILVNIDLIMTSAFYLLVPQPLPTDARISGPKSGSPTADPTTAPTKLPSAAPSVVLSAAPTCQPTEQLTEPPSATPTEIPTADPTAAPSTDPTVDPSASPSVAPSESPSADPTLAPSADPTLAPSTNPSASPSVLPSAYPSASPTVGPTESPSAQPSPPATKRPSVSPRALPTMTPSRSPSSAPTVLPSRVPSVGPTRVPSSVKPTTPPSVAPSRAPNAALKTISVALLTTRVEVDSVTPGVLSVSVDALPTEEVTITLTAVSGSGMSVLYPSAITFTSTSASTTVKVTFVAGAAGVYDLVLAVAGASTNEYKKPASGLQLRVSNGDDVIPAAPQLDAARFSTDGSTVSVTFDAATDRAGVTSAFVCSQLLTFAGDAVHSCQWRDASTVVIYPTAKVTPALRIHLDSPLSLRADNKIRPECTSTAAVCATWPTALAAEVTVQAPLVLQPPVVSLIVPSDVHGCADLVVDLSASTGAGGRPWTRHQFSVQLNPVTNVPAVESLLISTFSVSPRMVVPNTMLMRQATYTISVTLCNFLGACATESHSVAVDKDGGNPPVVSIAGTAQRSVVTSAGLRLTATAYVASCNGTASSAQLESSWAVYQDDQLVTTLVSVSRDALTFRLPAYALTPRHTYQVVFSAQSVASGLSAMTSVEVVVQQAPLQAVLAGGLDRSVALGRMITLDASGSSDGDISGAKGSAAGLLYTWSCIQALPISNTLCPLTLHSDSSTADTITLEASYSSVNTTAKVTVTVTDAAHARSASVTALVRTQPPAAPSVAITTDTSKVTAVNVNNQLTLTGRVFTESACTARWTANADSVNLVRSALTPLSAVVGNGASRVVSLVLAANRLPERSDLAFTLSCGASSAQISVTTNGPPTPGQFAVTPSTGAEVATPFQLIASVWSDSDLPLTYQFGFIAGSTETLMVLQGRSETSFGSTGLPAGSPEADNALTVVAQVFDVLNAFATATRSVTVTSDQPASELQDALLLQLSSSAGNAEATKNAIALGSAVMNVVDCSLAPNCTTLHRASCGKVQATCGACLSGYLGQAGDSNEPCLSAADVPSTTSGHTCHRASDCSVWEYCDTTSATCALRSKACAVENCSGHGQCVWLNTDTKRVLESCSVLDPSCAAECACFTGYGGISCASTTETLNSKRATRAEFLTGLGAVTASDDVSAESVTAWSVSLDALAQEPTELPESSLDTVTTLAQSIFTSAADTTDLSYQATMGVLNAMDAASRAARADTTPRNNSAVLETLTLYGDLIGTQLAPEQDGVEIVYENFRLSAVKQAGNTDISLPVPQTDMEKAYGSAASVVTIASATNASDTESGDVAASVISTSASAYGELGSQFSSNPLRITVASSTVVMTSAVVKLMHTAPMEYTNSSAADSMVFNTTCVPDDPVSIYEYTCPVSNYVITHNCTGLSGVMSSYCPVLAPSCAILNAADSTLDHNSTQCVVTAFDAWSTTCLCNVTSSSVTHRRLSSALADSGVLDVVSSSVYLANQFANTFHSAEDFNSLEDLRRVLIVIVMFSTLWAGGIFMICGCVWRQKALQKVNLQKKAGLERKKQSAQISRSPAAVRQYLVDYVVETFPSVFSNKPFMSRMYGEIKRHHRYLTLFTAPSGESGDKQRILTGVQLLTVQTMLMFLLALLYDVQGPVDDGTCSYHTDEVSCLSKKSPFDSSQSYCDWSLVHAQSVMSTCSYQEPQFSLQVIIYISVMVALMVAIIQFPVDRLFELLTAPVADDLKLSAQDSTLKLAGRHVANIARRASNVALNVAQVAKTKLSDARASIVGSDARKIPESTEAAHALAAASVSVIAESSRLALQDRQLARLRMRHEFTQQRSQRYEAQYSDSEVDVESGGESLSDSSSDSGASVDSKVNVRRPERVSNNQQRMRALPRAEPEASLVTSQKLTPANSTETTLTALCEEITYQRRFLKTTELEEFDAQWGIDPMGEFLQGEKSLLPCFLGKLGARELISKELLFVEKETAKKEQKLQVAMDTHTGLEILHLFIMDLLGRRTPAARIFETKTAEDFEHTKVVSRNAKRFAALGLVAINGFFIYYALLTGFNRGLSWQRMYLTACIVQFVVEILLFETMECLWINCMVPMLVSAEVRAVGDSIIEIIQKLCSAERYVQNDHFLNAPDYLFVSTNVAKKFPALMESILVQAYSSHLPGEIAKTWQVGAFARIHRRHQALRSGGVMATALGIVQYCATAPFVVHRMVVRFVQPFVFSALALLWEVIIANDANIAATCVVLAVFAAVAVYLRCRSQQSATQNKVDFEGEIGTVDGALCQHDKMHALTSAEEVKVEYALSVVTVLDGVSVIGSSVSKPPSSKDGGYSSSDKLHSIDSDGFSVAIPMLHSPFTGSPVVRAAKSRSPRAGHHTTGVNAAHSGSGGSPRMSGSPFTSPSGILRFRKKFQRKSTGQAWDQPGASDADVEQPETLNGLGTVFEHTHYDSAIPHAPITSPNSLLRHSKRSPRPLSVIRSLSSVTTDSCPSLDNFSELSVELGASKDCYDHGDDDDTDEAIPPPPAESPYSRTRFDSEFSGMERGSGYYQSDSRSSEDKYM